MNLLPKSKEEFAETDYWNAFFKKRGNKAFEWYGEYPELCGHLHKYIKVKDNILIVGCGNSILGNDLHDVGYKKITSIDISSIVIKQMVNLNQKDRPAMQFIQMDALNMSFEERKFSVVLDKGTLDALMPNDKNETIERIDRYFREISRVLKDNGRYICVSLLQEHILKKILSYSAANDWSTKIIRCHEAESKTSTTSDNTLPVFMVVCSKTKSTSSMLLEVSLSADNKFIKYEAAEEVLQVINGIQKAAFVCAHLKSSSMVNQEQISFDLFENENAKPRFSVYIADIRPEKGNSPYAAFIVPQGREAEWLFSTNEGRIQLTKMTKNNRLVIITMHEAEWLFSTNEGRIQLTKMTKNNRLVIITMHRDQKYGTLDDVKQELNDVVKNFAPTNITQKIAFLSLGSDVGNRIVRHKGKSKYSGDYIIEDVEVENGIKYRRLYYLQSQLTIQSEAQLKTVKSRRGHPKDVVNPLYLTCKHHMHMNVGTYLTCTGKESPSILIIGLGGGGLYIDEDMLKIATEWFGFHQDEKLTVDISDGIDFIGQGVKKESKWNAILFDVDSKDTTIGMSCPPKQFLEDELLKNVASILTIDGAFILNMVLRDTTLRSPIIKKLQSNFKTIASYKLEEDLNEVVICFKEDMTREKLVTLFRSSCKEINKFMKTNGLPKEEYVDISDYINNLNIGNDYIV
ncbi:Methyltransferase domain [Popillia japonica]|uniref:Methyltransferase domain n=1 Tax=Popillia japonica TaxID=7064 RepID=A0AAW1HUY8_POPJA